MPVELTRENVRDIAKNVRELTGRDIKHTAIIEAIAAALGKRGDALMHELKGETPRSPRTRGHPASAEEAAHAAGFAVSMSLNGERWFTARLLETRIHGWASLNLFIYAIEGGRRSTSAKPDDAVWMVDLRYACFGRCIDDEAPAAATLEEAIVQAYAHAEARHEFWRGCTTARIDYDLDETNPLMFTKVKNQAVRPDEDSTRQLRYAGSYGFMKGVARNADGVEIDCLQSDYRRFDTAFGDVTFRVRIAADGPDGIGSDPQAEVWRTELNFEDPSMDEGLTYVGVSHVAMDHALQLAKSIGDDARSFYETVVRAKTKRSAAAARRS
ncbi:hypothetical protein [Rhizobium leguminosarum]|uniref:hypothetical protein n=1 Tax=Rhizobium leguminosarum TaxID=384 RepID=UPI002E0F4F95|nr:hypothetical protein U8Q02_41570 [Rhizobium leguminosarum]